MTTATKPRKPKETVARTFTLTFTDGQAAALVRIGGKDYTWRYYGMLAGYDLIRTDGLVHEVRREWHNGVLRWSCDCEAFLYAKATNKTCRHIDFGRKLGLIE